MDIASDIYINGLQFLPIYEKIFKGWRYPIYGEIFYMNGLQFLPIYRIKRRTIIGFQIPITVIIELISIHGISMFYLMDFASDIYMNG